MWYSFQSELPWTICGEWATNCCLPDNETKPDVPCVRDVTQFPNDTGVTWNTEWTSPSQEFWENKVLMVTNGVDDLGRMNWGMVLCLCLSWIISYFCVWKSVKQTGKVVYFTATFPLLMLFVLLIRGITLDGAWNGVYYYMVPDMERMKDPKVWVEAGTQIFFSYALCKGQLISLGSYNKFNTNLYKHVWWLSAFNSGTSFISGFAIFSILGFMAQERGIRIEDVAESGPGLAFIAYPRAVALLPCPQLWAVLFFFMILLLGLDSQFVGLEAVITAVTDMYPAYRKGMKRQYLLFTIVGISFCVGLTMCLQGGIYIFTLFDYYGASGICLLWLCLCECIAIGWVYGGEKFWQNTKSMIGYRPLPLFKWCWMFITPVMIIILLVMLIIDFKPLSYKNTRQNYQYPMWFESIGWCLAACSILPIIIYAIVRIVASFIGEGGSTSQRWQKLTKTTLKNDHPDKNTENKAPERMDIWTFYFGDWLGEKVNRMHNRYKYANGATVQEPEIIRYNKENTNC